MKTALIKVLFKIFFRPVSWPQRKCIFSIALLSDSFYRCFFFGWPKLVLSGHNNLLLCNKNLRCAFS